MVMSVDGKNIILSSPHSVFEYEDFYVKVDKNTDFRLEIASKCLSVQKTSNIRQSDGMYSTGNSAGLVYFDNKCFEKQKIDMIFRLSGGAQENIKYIVSPKKEEKIDMGC